MTPEKIPVQFKPFFWDTEFDTVDPNKHPHYVIERLLDKGTIQAIRWVRKNFSETQIRETLMQNRGFSLKNASFWATIYDIPLNKIKCFQEPYLTTRRTHWPY